MDNCIFCKIIKGDIPSHKVYEDKDVFAFLDIHPINPGHILVISKFHEPDFYKLEDSIYESVMMVVKNLSNIVKEKMNPKRVGLIVAGWDVPHTHIHVVPMNDFHDITSKSFIEGNRANPTNEELTEVANKIKNGGK